MLARTEQHHHDAAAAWLDVGQRRHTKATSTWKATATMPSVAPRHYIRLYVWIPGLRQQEVKSMPPLIYFIPVHHVIMFLRSRPDFRIRKIILNFFSSWDWASMWSCEGKPFKTFCVIMPLVCFITNSNTSTSFSITDYSTHIADPESYARTLLCCHIIIIIIE